MHEGAQDSNDGKSRRFATARNAKSRLWLTMSGATRSNCEALCDEEADCLGYYLFVTKKDASRCTGLSDIGDDEDGDNDGVLEGIVSYSYRKVDYTSTTPTTTEIVSTTTEESTTPTTTPDPGYWYKLIFETPHRFANAKQRITNGKLNLLFFMQEDVTLHLCQMKCNGISNCAGIYYFEADEFETLRCYGLAVPDTENSKLIRNPGYSYIRMDPGTEDDADSGELKSAPADPNQHTTKRGWLAAPAIIILMIVAYVARAGRVIAEPSVPSPRTHYYPGADNTDGSTSRNGISESADFDALNGHLRSPSPTAAMEVAEAAAMNMLLFDMDSSSPSRADQCKTTGGVSDDARKLRHAVSSGLELDAAGPAPRKFANHYYPPNVATGSGSSIMKHESYSTSSLMFNFGDEDGLDENLRAEHEFESAIASLSSKTIGGGGGGGKKYQVLRSAGKTKSFDELA